MANLAPRDFAAYFEAVHEHRPFPWQERLLAQVASDGRWPSLLDLPTGTGKTAAIDVAVFHLALDAERPSAERSAPRRIVMVVDRRTVVDQAFERAKKISNALKGATHGVLATVRERLCGLSGTEEPLARAQLRGGMPRDDAWARRPDQPLVAVSTVDQVGSRLLFRGYGVSDAMRPIHAGLLGYDTLLLLDEVHLSQPFLQTLEAIRRYRTWHKTSLPDRWQFVAMSATPGQERSGFGLTEEDHQDERLARRLRAAKPIEHAVVKVAGTEAARRMRLAEELAKRVAMLAEPGRAVGVVVNRVATALDVFKLVRRHQDNGVFLVTGRMRPLDRNDLDKEISELVRSGRARDATATPIVVVATQCIEAGADFDFDALVTECASLDALRQRFGRLNRLGSITDARGVVLVRSDALGKDEPDFVYGRALEETWEWIEQTPRDFGIQAMNACLPTGDALARLLPALSRAPIMLPAHLDAWTQTTPIPQPDPDVSLWLHGVDQRRDADVQIVWRADVSAELIRQAEPRQEVSSGEGRRIEGALAALVERMDVCPPNGLEALAVPIGAARAWLAGTPALDVADVEGRSANEDERGRQAENGMRSALLWKGDESVVVHAEGLRPGMTLVVPSTYGGLAFGTWDPSSTAPVSDLGDRARWEQTRRPTLRLHPALMASGGPKPPTPANDDDPNEDERERVADWLTLMESAAVPGWLGEIARAMKKNKRRPPTIVRIDAAEIDDGTDFEPGYLGLVGRVRVPKDGVEDGEDVSTEDDGASYTGVRVTLDAHMKGVRTWAGGFAMRCGLPTELIGDIEIAARWHDAGKVDPRFQRMLRGGSPLSDDASEPLAKSRIVASDRATRLRARERSGYPKGARHELSSVSLLQKETALLAKAADRDLVLHLVASHHGWCRPFAPVVEDREPVDLTLNADGVNVNVSSKHDFAALDSGIPERFWVLVERYGWFGLAWLEAILRLADHRRSEEEQSPAFAETESA
jgi:CRISPR-associated endonuclease/helicase Cas3